MPIFAVPKNYRPSTEGKTMFALCMVVGSGNTHTATVMAEDT